ncbi:MAG: hypothetical protein L3J21_09710 [Devosiaceae bacterium]|nr:hypothetical protein [Devosiaceae bacterium]
MKLSRWARATLFTGALMLAIAIIPLWLSTIFLSSSIPTLFALAFFMVGPLGAMIFFAGLVMFVIAALRR